MMSGAFSLRDLNRLSLSHRALWVKSCSETSRRVKRMALDPSAETGEKTGTETGEGIRKTAAGRRPGRPSSGDEAVPEVDRVKDGDVVFQAARYPGGPSRDSGVGGGFPKRAGPAVNASPMVDIPGFSHVMVRTGRGEARHDVPVVDNAAGGYLITLFKNGIADAGRSEGVHGPDAF